MSSIDVDSLLEELAPDSPCGEDLEYDPEFGEMERAMEPKAEQQFGDTIVPAEPPDWRDVKRKALNLAKRTKDMRVTAYLARAALATDGLEGFGDALTVMRGLVDNYWDDVHPQLDPDDDNDPTFRINMLASLCDADTTLQMLRDAPMVQSKMMGSFSLHQVRHAQEHPDGRTVGSGDSAIHYPKLSEVEAAFSDAEPESMQATLEMLTKAEDDLVQLENVVTEKVGVANATSLDPAVHVLKEVQQVLTEQMERRGIGAPGEEEAAEETAEDDWGTSASGATAATQPLTGDVSNREDAIRALDKVCEYFDRHEPSSPLPLLIRRAQRLASKSFLEIIRDLAPDGIAQAEAIGGPGGASGESAGGSWASSGDGGGGGGSSSSSESSSESSSSTEESSGSDDNW